MNTYLTFVILTYAFLSLRLYCGRPDRCDELGGNEVEVNMNGQHGVRCCTEDSAVGWPNECNDITGVYGESSVPNCYSSSTFTEAVAICAAYSGGRLCSRDEILDNCTKGTGCSLDSALVWGCIANNKAETCVSNAECCSGNCNVGTCTA